jgi:hypothetical protein
MSQVGADTAITLNGADILTLENIVAARWWPTISSSFERACPALGECRGSAPSCLSAGETDYGT